MATLSSSLMAQSVPLSHSTPSLSKVAATLLATSSIPVVCAIAKRNIDSNLWSHKIVWAIAFIANFITVSLPGRFDSEAQENKQGFPWVTLFEPAGWAFAIWGVIYAGELALTIYASFLSSPTALFREAAPFWLAGNLFQSLWCLTFRPEFRSAMWVPMSLLALGSTSLLLAHQVFTATLKNEPSWLLLALRAPVSLHAAWLAAATCLNLNGWAVMEKASYPLQIAVAFASCFLGAGIGALTSLQSGDPLLAATIAWALAALASRTALKVEKNTIPYVSADTQKALALTEGTLSKTLQALVLVMLVYATAKTHLGK
jgi:hypothetical protein